MSIWPYLLVGVGLINVSRQSLVVMPRNYTADQFTIWSALLSSYGTLAAGIVWAILL